MYCKLSHAAANWWLEQMKRRCSISFPAKVIRDNSGYIIVNDLLEKDFSRFQKILVEQIYSTLESEHYSNLFCYYYPCPELLALSQQANISTAYFPIKEQLIVAENSIKVSTNLIDFEALHLCANNL